MSLDTAQEGKVRDPAHSAHSQERVVGTTVRRPDTAAEGSYHQSIHRPQSLLVKVDGITSLVLNKCFLGGSVVKNLSANAGDVGSIPGWGRSLGEGNGNPLQYPCLRNPVDRGAWRATFHGVTNESGTT